MAERREMINLPEWVQVAEAQAPAGTEYWRLTRIEFLDEDRSGGRHHIDIMEPHSPQHRFTIRNENGNKSESTALDKPANEPAANYPMWGMPNKYEAYMEGLPSDKVRGMEMRGNVHVVYRLWYEKARKVTDGGGAGHSEPPPVSPPPGNSQGTPLGTALLAKGEEKLKLRFNPTAAIQKAIFRDGFVPNSDEFSLAQDGVSYLGQRAERLSDGKVRVYYCKQGDFANVQFVERP